MSREERYSRQSRFAPIGLAGQSRIAQAAVCIVGCGALGSSMANTLARAGVGKLVLVDADRVEWSNLQRQTLFDEADARNERPKVEAAAARLQEINSQLCIRPIVREVDATNIEETLGNPDLILDGTDRFPIRYLLNDYAVAKNLRWIYGGCAASHGTVMAIEPGKTPCLRCIFPDLPDPSDEATADTVGIIAPVAHLVAALQVAEGLKWLAGRDEALVPVLYQVDLWTSSLQSIRLEGPDDRCPCCAQGRYDFLRGKP